jgi:hypothetical protein
LFLNEDRVHVNLNEFWAKVFDQKLLERWYKNPYFIAYLIDVAFDQLSTYDKRLLHYDLTAYQCPLFREYS